jgi:Zn-finger nucleic acid-binding protein
MIVVEYHKVELDYCSRCHGVWFDSGELELLLDSGGIGQTKSFIESILKSPDTKTSEKKRKCPICIRDMRKVNIRAVTEEVFIDTCAYGHGIWFDGGEVDHLFKFLSEQPASKGEHQQVFNFIDEVFKAR